MTGFIYIRQCILCCALLSWNGLTLSASEQLQYKDLNVATYYDNLELALSQLADILPEQAPPNGKADSLLQRSRRNRLIVYGKLCERVRNAFYQFGIEHPDMLQADDLAVWEFLDREFKSPASRFAMDWNTVDPAHMREVLQAEWNVHLRASQGDRSSAEAPMSEPPRHGNTSLTQHPPLALQVFTKTPSVSPPRAKEATPETLRPERTETVSDQHQWQARTLEPQGAIILIIALVIAALIAVVGLLATLVRGRCRAARRR